MQFTARAFEMKPMEREEFVGGRPLEDLDVGEDLFGQRLAELRPVLPDLLRARPLSPTRPP